MATAWLRLQVDDAGLDEGGAVCDVDLEDVVHARGGDDDAADGRDGAAAEPGAGAARDDGQVVATGDLDGGGDLLRRVGEDDDLGLTALDSAVVLEDDEVFGGVQDAVAAEDAGQLIDGDGRDGAGRRRVSRGHEAILAAYGTGMGRRAGTGKRARRAKSTGAGS